MTHSFFFLYSMMNALSEGLCLANSSGLSQQTLLDVLVLSQPVEGLVVQQNRIYRNVN